MDFQLNEGQRILQKEIRRFLEKEIAPLVNEYEYERKPLTKEIIKKLEPFGFTRAIVPEERGGLGDLVSYFIMIEELSRVWGSLRTLISVSSLAAYTIAMRGTKEQREKFLPGLFSLDILACFALTEPNVGSDASAVETTAERKGNHYLINGSKTMITGGSMADVVCLYATVDRSKKEKGITAFLVKKGESEFEASNIKKMGMHSSVLSELSFDDSRVPIENRLGEEGEGLRIAPYWTEHWPCCCIFWSCWHSAGCLGCCHPLCQKTNSIWQTDRWLPACSRDDCGYGIESGCGAVIEFKGR